MSEPINIFAYVTRHSIRFTSSRGQLDTEQLWTVPLQSKDGFDLDAIAKISDKALKEATEVSFVKKDTKAKTAKQERLEAALDVIKYIIDVKITEEEKAKKRADNKKQKEALIEALAEKETGALAASTVEELKKKIAELDKEE